MLACNMTSWVEPGSSLWEFRNEISLNFNWFSLFYIQFEKLTVWIFLYKNFIEGMGIKKLQTLCVALLIFMMLTQQQRGCLIGWTACYYSLRLECCNLNQMLANSCGPKWTAWKWLIWRKITSSTLKLKTILVQITSLKLYGIIIHAFHDWKAFLYSWY